MKWLQSLRLFLYLIVIVVSLSIIPTQTEALLCEYISIEEEIEQVDIVFKGKVTSVEGHIDHHQRYLFDVQIEGISTEQAIAVEESNGQYIKAYREDEYKVPLSSSFGDPQVMMNTIVLLGLGLLSFILVGKVIKNNRGKW